MVKDLLKNRILTIDGAMGTMVQSFKLDEKDFYDNVHTTIRGSEKISNLIYSDLKKFLKNNWIRSNNVKKI